MAFFKSRKASAEQSASAPTPKSVEVMRKRARNRLAGAVVLVVAGVVVFPLLFDKQPRPIAVDIPIEIPDRDKVKPLSPLGVPAATESKLAEPAEANAANAANASSKSSTPAPAASAGMPPASKAGQVAKPSTQAADKEETILVPGKAAVAASTPASIPASIPAPKPVSAAPDAARTASKLAEKSKDQPAANGRYVVQFGAFADAARAQVARDKVEKLGFKTYAQVAETPEGKKYRVRVGPFEKRADAQKAAEKIKRLELPAAILVL